MKLNMWDIILAFGIFQGFISCILILVRKKNNPLAAKTLSGILAICILIISSMLMGMQPPSEIIRTIEKLTPLNLTFLIGPLLYFHIQSTFHVNLKINKNQAWHFAPVLINLVPTFCEYFLWFSDLFKISTLERPDVYQFLHYYVRITEGLVWLHLTTYIFYSKKNLLREKSLNKKSNSYDNWLQYFLNYFLIIQVIWFPFMVTSLTPYHILFLEYPYVFYLLYIPLVGLVYAIGIKFLMDTPSLSKSKLTLEQKEIKELEFQINKLFNEEKIYLNNPLTLTHLAKQTATNTNRISWYFNQHRKISFNDFINQHRVNEAKQKLSNPAFDYLTISAIALESGFNSIPTFQRVFKLVTNQSPKEFKRQSRK